MACDCEKLEQTPLWSPVPEYRQPTDIQPGENIECYAKRAGSVSGQKNDAGGQVANRIANTSLTSDLSGVVSTTFKLTPTSTRTATTWQITVNGVLGLAPLSELTFNSGTGLLSGTVSDANANKSYQVTITASDTSQIDSRTFTFYPKKNTTKGDTIKFVIPLIGNSHVVCGYGPRTAPTFGASTMHNGYDFAMVDHSQGIIVAAADGVVVKTGPATGFGNWIVIEHYDSQERLVCTTVYGHMNDGNTFVNVGDKVAAGQKIALEGNNGIGTGMHLHFEIHKGKWRSPTDPGPYLNGTLSVASDNDPNTAGPDGTQNPTSFAPQTISNSGMTHGEAQADNGCPAVLPNDTALPPKLTSAETAPAPPSSNINKNRSACAGPTPSASAVIAQIQQACNDDTTSPALTAYDKQWIQTVASIESNLDPFAKNPTSSATGLYQFTDALAVKYYGIISVPCTCQNRCDPYQATRAMIAFYKAEVLPYWNNYVASTKTTIAGKPIQSTAWSSQYTNLNQGEFMYGLIHHDGVGNAVAGLDRQGVAYWRSKVGTA